MRKYFLSLFLIITGLILLIYIYSQNNKVKYSETLFSDDAKVFDTSFTNFVDGVEENKRAIQSNFDDNSKIRDTTEIKKFFFNYLNSNPYLLSVGFFQDNYKIAFRKEENSLVFAIDSTERNDVVRWQRFEGDKLISTWQESFEEPINKTDWYKRVKQKNDQILWFFRIKNEENKEGDLKETELFYAGFSYELEDANYIVLFQFSRQELLNDLGITAKAEHFNLLLETADGENIDLVSGILKNSEWRSKSDLQKDSLRMVTLSHFDKFKDKESDVFKFSFKDIVYWNSFKRFPPEKGLLNYLLTIPNSALIQSETGFITNYLTWPSIFLILIGIALLFVKKRIFYRSRKISMPMTKEILKKDESRYLEFKSSSRWDYRQEKVNPELEKVITKTIAAFGNTDGGILLIGVDDDKKILGLEKDFTSLKKSTVDYYEIHLRNILHNTMGVRYVSKNIRIKFETCDKEKVVCKIRVLAGNQPVYLKVKNKSGHLDEKFYVRSGNSSQEIKSIAEINDYINTRFKK